MANHVSEVNMLNKEHQSYSCIVYTIYILPNDINTSNLTVSKATVTD